MGSSGDGDKQESTCALHKGGHCPALADACQVRTSTHGAGGGGKDRSLLFQEKPGIHIFLHDIL